jgi:hypothetical protein
MKKALILFLLLQIHNQLLAQDAGRNMLVTSLRRDARIDRLFAIRSALLVSDSSTRRVDRELAALGVRFPAKVSLATFGGKLSMAFSILDDYEITEITAKLDRLRVEISSLEYVGVDMDRHLCLATFSGEATQLTLERFLKGFNYSGFYVEKEQSIVGKDQSTSKFGMQE